MTLAQSSSTKIGSQKTNYILLEYQAFSPDTCYGKPVLIKLWPSLTVQMKTHFVYTLAPTREILYESTITFWILNFWIPDFYLSVIQVMVVIWKTCSFVQNNGLNNEIIWKSVITCVWQRVLSGIFWPGPLGKKPLFECNT